MLLWSASDHTRGLRREDFTLMSVTANWPTLHLQHTTNILLTQYIHPWILQLFLPRFHVPFPCHHTTGHWERFRELNPLPFHDLKPPILGQALPAPDILPLSPNNCLISCPELRFAVHSEIKHAWRAGQHRAQAVNRPFGLEEVTRGGHEGKRAARTTWYVWGGCHILLCGMVVVVVIVMGIITATIVRGGGVSHLNRRSAHPHWRLFVTLAALLLQ